MTAYDLSTHDFNDPDPWVALGLDRSTFFDPVAKAALMRNNRTWSRRRLLPIVRVFARLMVILTQLVRIFFPKHLTMPKLLHSSIVWGMKNFVSRDANYLILRHFHVGTQTLRFISDNVGGLEMVNVPLRPRTIDDLGANMFLQHDLNIFNFIIQVNAQLIDQNRDIAARPYGAMDLSAIEDFDALLAPQPNKWTNVLDL